MNSFIRSPADFWAGLIYLALGVAGIVIVQEHELGTALKMGPAYFPSVLGGLLACIGLVSLIRSLRLNGDRITGLNLRGILLIAAPVILFAALVRHAGALVAIPLLVCISAYASSQFNLVRTILLAFGLTAFCGLVFIKGLGIPMPLLGAWFGN